MNGFRYLVVGLDYKVAGGTMGEPECGQPICPMAIPVKPTVELQPQYALHGFETIQTDSSAWQPRSIGGMEFPSHETARFWLDQTHDGEEFKRFFKFAFVARVRG